MTQNTNAPTEETSDHTSHEDEREEYSGGAIEARHGYIPLWLLGVYAVLGDSTTPTPIGAASVQGGSTCQRLKAEK